MTTGKQERPAVPTIDDGRALGGTKEHLSKILGVSEGDVYRPELRATVDWGAANERPA